VIPHDTNTTQDNITVYHAAGFGNELIQVCTLYCIQPLQLQGVRSTSTKTKGLD